MRSTTALILAALLSGCGGGPGGPGGPDLQPLRWTSQRTSTGFDLWSVWGSGPDDVYAVGYRGSVMRSVDRGQSWQVSMMGSLATLEGVWGSGPDDVYAVGGDLIFHSTDRGKSWEKHEEPALFDLLAVGGSGADNVYVSTSKGNVFRSTDRGKSWTLLRTGFDKALMSLWTDGGNLFVAGLGGAILHSADFGGSFTPRPSGTTRDLLSLWGQGGTLFATGNFTAGAAPEPGPVLRSTDGGLSWALVASQPGNYLSGVWSAGKDVVVSGDHGRVLRSSDGGATFQGEQLDGQLNAVWASGARDIYLVGSGGLIVRGQ